GGSEFAGGHRCGSSQVSAGGACARRALGASHRRATAGETFQGRRGDLSTVEGRVPQEPLVARENALAVMKPSIPAMLLIASAFSGVAGVPAHADWISFGVGDGLPSNDIGVVQQDGRGEYWIASGSALARYDGARWFTYDSANSPLLAGDRVLAIADDHRGELWVGTRAGGLFVLDSTRTQWRSVSGLPTTPNGPAAVQAIIEDHAGVIWIGTSAGIVSIDGPRSGRHTYDPSNLPQMSNANIQ